MPLVQAVRRDGMVLDGLFQIRTHYLMIHIMVG